MGRVLKKLSAISLTFLVFATNMARVEDLVNDGTCQWICKTENGDIDSKELEEIISQGKLIKLALVHQARVDQTCANQTSNAINHRSKKFAEIWLKKMSVSSSRGIVESLSLAVLETIYSGLIFYGSYREMSVTCIFKSTTMPASNHSSRLALFTPQSVMYFVESLVLNENDTFLTLMRVEGQTRIAVESERSSRDTLVAAKDNEMIVSNTWWFAVIAMIWIGMFFYPAILLLCRPSQVTVQLVRKTREEREDERLTKLPTQAEDKDDINPMNNDGHATEHVDSNGGDNVSPASPDVITDFTGIMETQRPPEEDEGTPLSREDTEGSRNSELAMAAGRPSRYRKEKGQLYVRLPNHETEGKQPGDVREKLIGSTEKPACDEPAKIEAPIATATRAKPVFPAAQQVQSSENCDVYGNTSRLASADKVTSDDRKRQEHVFTSNVGTAVGAATACEVPVKKPCTVDERTAKYSSDNEVITRSEHSTTEEKEEVNTANKSAVYTTLAVVINMPQSDHSSTEIEGEELRSANAADEHSINTATNNATHTSINYSSSEIDSRNTDENCACMIMVGGPDPVSIGSWIGNYFFSVTNKTKFPRLKEVGKLFLITFCPLLLFTAVGDVLLELLNFHSRVALNLPNRSLTGSVIHVICNLPLRFIILAIVSFICYFLRCCFLFGIIPSNISKSITWKSCFVHSRLPLLPWRDEHEYSTQECPKNLEVPENILHNLKELPDIFEKLVFLFGRCFSQYIKTTEIWLPTKVFFFLLALIILIVCFLGNLVVGVLLSSPLVCLCHGRMWILNERFQGKFWGSHFFLPILECGFISFSLFWVAFYLSGCTIVIKIAGISFITTLSHNTKEMLPHLTVVILACHYFWSCYSCFKVPYCDLVKKLFTSYKEKFDELEKNRGPNELISYKQGEHLKLIPRELFKYACKHKLIDIPVKNTLWIFLVKLGLPLLLFTFIFPVIQAPSTDSAEIGFAITFLTAAYSLVNSYINGATSGISEGDVDEVVKEYIKKQQ